MDLRPRFLLWVDILMFFVGFGLVFVVAFAWANPEEPPATWEDRLSITTPEARDRSLSAAVSTALRLDPDLGGYPLQVSTHAGVVELRGAVPTAAMRTQAAALASQTPGVVRVENRVRVREDVKPHPAAADDHRAAAP